MELESRIVSVALGDEKIPEFLCSGNVIRYLSGKVLMNALRGEFCLELTAFPGGVVG